jgi:hypothetical protein
MAGILKLVCLSSLVASPSLAAPNYGDMPQENMTDDAMMQQGFFSAENVLFMFKEIGDVVGMLF